MMRPGSVDWRYCRERTLQTAHDSPSASLGERGHREEADTLWIRCPRAMNCCTRRNTLITCVSVPSAAIISGSPIASGSICCLIPAHLRSTTAGCVPVTPLQFQSDGKAYVEKLAGL